MEHFLLFGSVAALSRRALRIGLSRYFAKAPTPNA
jgi:hypothetical protein